MATIKANSIYLQKDGIESDAKEIQTASLPHLKQHSNLNDRRFTIRAVLTLPRKFPCYTLGEGYCLIDNVCRKVKSVKCRLRSNTRKPE